MGYLTYNFIIPLFTVSLVVSLIWIWHSDLITDDGGQAFGRNFVNKFVTKTDNEDLGAVLRRKVKLLCWILTGPKTINTKARAISETWAKHCDITLYISSKKNQNPPATVVNTQEGRDHLTHKSKAAFELIYKQYYNKADWFLKADDDSFIIVDNLRYLLAHYDPRLPLHFGHQFYYNKKSPKFKTGMSWHSGGAGYVLSREALRKLVIIGLKTCPYEKSEDFYIGQCLEKLNVVQGLSADRSGLPSFLPLSASAMVSERADAVPKWYQLLSVHYANNTRLGCCSQYSISFHYVPPEDMYLLYFLIYKIRRFGLPDSSPSLTDSIYTDPDVRPLSDSIRSLPDPELLRRQKTTPKTRS